MKNIELNGRHGKATMCMKNIDLDGRHGNANMCMWRV